MTTRILHVSQPSDAGVATVLLGYLERQRLLGDDVVLGVACPRDGHLATQVQELGLQLIPWEATRGPGPSVASEVRAFSQLVASWRPDLIHLHSSKAGLVGRLAVRGRIPTVFQPHAWSFEAVTGITATLSRLWERQDARWSHVTVCVSAAELAAAPSSDITSRAQVIPNAVDPTQWPVGERSSARKVLGLEEGAPYAVCVGRLCEQKGQDSLLAIWTAIRDRVPQAELVLVGDGPHAEMLKDSCPPGVTLVGAQDAAPWYAASDVVVVPSRWEGMAMVPLEAQASGRLVIAYDVDGMAESLGSGNVLIPPGNSDQLAEAISTALADLPNTRDLGRMNREYAVQTSSADDQLGLLQTAYNDARQRCDEQTRARPAAFRNKRTHHKTPDRKTRSAR